MHGQPHIRFTIYEHLLVCYLNQQERLGADSHYTSRFRSVADRHCSVKFSHVQLNGDVHTDRNVSVTFQFRSVAVAEQECLT